MLKRYSIVILLSAGLMGWGCAVNPPLNEIVAAELELDTAREALAQVYAMDEYRVAEKSLRRAKKAIEMENHEAARTLSEIAALQAQYAQLVTNWKIKAHELKKAHGALQQAMEETEQARLMLEETKKQLR